MKKINISQNFVKKMQEGATTPDQPIRCKSPKEIIENKMNQHVILKALKKWKTPFEYDLFARGFVQLNQTTFPAIISDVLLKEKEQCTVLSAIVVAKWVFFSVINLPDVDLNNGMFSIRLNLLRLL